MLVNKGSRAEIGSKAYDLYRCQLLDVKVPEFYVISTSCYTKSMGNIIERSLKEELTTIFSKLGKNVAVRSSSVVEDLSTGSNAGQFKTFLNVKTFSDLIKSIKHVWSSANGQAIAVIIQKQLTPKLSGVLFTHNPINGEKEIVIEYVDGLCEKLVSGKNDPKRLIFKETKTHSSNRFSKLLQISKNLEMNFGYPLDIEWAKCNVTFYILQARPITNLRVSNIAAGKTYSRVQADQFFSGPVSPLFFSIFKELYTKYYIQETITSLGIDLKLSKDLLIKHKNYLYVDTSYYEYALNHLPINREQEQLLEIFPEDIRNDIINKNKKINPRDLFHIIKFVILNPKYWISNLDNYFHEEVVPEIIRRLEELDDLDKMSNNELIESYHKLFDITKLHIRTSKWGLGFYLVPVIRAMEEFLKKNGLKSEYLSILMSDLDVDKTLDASLELKKLVDMIKTESSLAELSVIRQDSMNYPLYKVQLERTQFGQKIIDYFELILKKYGHRRLSRDILAPSWYDEPMIPFSILKQLLNNGNSKPIEPKLKITNRRIKLERIIKNRLPLQKRWKFNLLSKYMVRYVAFRELQRFYLDLIISKMRTLIVEIGHRMLKDKVLKEVDDIFYLDYHDVLDYLSGEYNPKLNKKVEFNKLSFENNCTLPGKYMRLGVDFDSIPASKYNEKFNTKSSENIMPNNTIKGQPVSPGSFSGKVKVMENVDKDVEIQQNEIVVTKCIDPGQTHIFLLAGALIFEVGGMLSHGAILAREFNLPTVANVKNATQILKTGQKITVNGSSGEILLGR